MYIEEAKKSVKKLDKILNELKINLGNARREAIWSLPIGGIPEEWNDLLEDLEEICNIVSGENWDDLRH